MLASGMPREDHALRALQALPRFAAALETTVALDEVAQSPDLLARGRLSHRLQSWKPRQLGSPPKQMAEHLAVAPSASACCQGLADHGRQVVGRLPRRPKIVNPEMSAGPSPVSHIYPATVRVPRLDNPFHRVGLQPSVVRARRRPRCIFGPRCLKATWPIGELGRSRACLPSPMLL